MANRPNYHEPDAIDCDKLVAALAADFGVCCDITTAYALDKVTVLVRTYKPAAIEERVIATQALVSRPLRNAKNLFAMQFSALFDCWHQHDRGTLAVEARPLEYGWNGRPQVPAKHNRQ